MTFSYAYASQEQLVQHLANASRASVSAALRRYREQGQTGIVSRIKAAHLQARISRLAKSFTEKGD